MTLLRRERNQILMLHPLGLATDPQALILELRPEEPGQTRETLKPRTAETSTLLVPCSLS